MVEFALVFSVLLALVVGIFEMGRTVWSYTTVSFASRQAARFAIVNRHLGEEPGLSLDPNPIAQKVKENAIGLLPNDLQITQAWVPDNARGSQFKITVSYPVNLVGSSLFLPSSISTITVSSTSQMTIVN